MVHKTLYKAARAIKNENVKIQILKEKKNTWNILDGFCHNWSQFLGDEAAL